MYAYPAGTSFCSCKRKQNTLGGTPRPHAPERPLGTGCAVPKRGLNGAYRVSQTHLPPSPPLPRSGGGGSCPNHCSPYSCARQVPSAMGIRGEVNSKVLAHLWLSSPPQRRGEGWWFALRAPARRLLGSLQGRKTLWGEEGAPQRRGLPVV